MPPAPVTPEKTRQFLIVMWVAMVATLPVYYLLTMILKPTQADPGSPLPLPLFGVAIVMAVGSLFIKARFGVREGQQRSLAMVRGAYILALVITEVPALLGLIVYLVAAWPQYWAFFVISAGGYVVNFPQRDDFGVAGFDPG